MKLTRTFGSFAVAIVVCFVSVVHADVELSFDGVNTDGWSLTLPSGVAGTALSPIANMGGSGYNGLQFKDETPGSLFYVAPASILSLDWTGQKLSFAYQIVDPNSPSKVIVPNVADLYVNGKALMTYDVINESTIDAIQSVTIDFSDAVFANKGIDVANLSSLWIRAEWWQDERGTPATESYLLSAQAVPEPSCLSLLVASLLGALGYFRKQK